MMKSQQEKHSTYILLLVYTKLKLTNLSMHEFSLQIATVPNNPAIMTKVPTPIMTYGALDKSKL